MRPSRFTPHERLLGSFALACLVACGDSAEQANQTYDAAGGSADSGASASSATSSTATGVPDSSMASGASGAGGAGTSGMGGGSTSGVAGSSASGAGGGSSSGTAGAGASGSGGGGSSNTDDGGQSLDGQAGGGGTAKGDGAVPTTGLAAFWRFDEGMGASSADSSGRGNTLTLTGAQWVPGKSGSAVKGLGGTSSISPGDKLNALAIPFSISVWLKFEQSTIGRGGQLVIRSEVGVTRRGFLFQVTTGGDGYWLEHFDDSGNERQWIGNEPPAVGRWTHVAVVAAATEIRLYVDGQKKNGLLTGTGTTMASSTGSVQIARAFESEVNWAVDELAIYERELTDEEIVNLSGP